MIDVVGVDPLLSAAINEYLVYAAAAPGRPFFDVLTVADTSSLQPVRSVETFRTCSSVFAPVLLWDVSTDAVGLVGFEKRTYEFV